MSGPFTIVVRDNLTPELVGITSQVTDLDIQSQPMGEDGREGIRMSITTAREMKLQEVIALLERTGVTIAAV